MKQRHKIKGVLCNFLGTYTSRYSDYEGYWLFGLLANEVEVLSIDLLDSKEQNQHSKPFDFAVGLARRKFSEQLGKNDIDIGQLSKASLEIKKLSLPGNGFVNGRASFGHNFKFTVQAMSKHGKTYETDVTIFVAPHNPSIEARSSRALKS